MGSMNIKTVLVCGLPGTGKTTYASNRCGNGVVYDLDAIAAALRLSEPHAEQHDAARHIANGLLGAFLEMARKYSPEIIVIRTAPDIAELEAIQPDEVVICLRQYVRKFSAQTYVKRLMEIEKYCSGKGIELNYA